MCFFPLVMDCIFLIHILKLISLGQISVFLFLQVFRSSTTNKQAAAAPQHTRGFFWPKIPTCLILQKHLYPISVFMVNYFNLYSYSYDLVTVEILHQRGIYCNMHSLPHVCVLPDASWIPTTQGFAFQYILPNGLTKVPFTVQVENAGIPLKSTSFWKGAWSKAVQRSMRKFEFLVILSFQWLPWECQGLSKLLLLNTCAFNQACVLLLCCGQSSVLIYKNWLWNIKSTQGR